MQHIKYNDNKGISISSRNYLDGNKTEYDSLFNSTRFFCDNQVNYDKKTITFHNDYQIKLPISNNETIILKSMNDYNSNKISKVNHNELCSIMDETLNKAKPLQFPYSTFSEINQFEQSTPITHLLARLYYNTYKPNEESFEDIVNECCDLIDDALIPDCNMKKNIKFKLEKCQENKLIMNIIYENCKANGNDLPKNVECFYIPTKNINGFKKQKYVALSGYDFLISLIITSSIIDNSVFFWVGELKKYKCILRVWFMVFG
eukprot:jgi/Orpsp1_1/1189262/evm.model.d7180000070694.1